MFGRLTVLCVTAMLLAGPAHAFTFENGSKSVDSIPKFDLEEQSKQFRTPSLDTSASKGEYNTPIGKLQFGVQPDNSMYGYRSPFAPTFGPSGNADRRHYDRMFTPEYLQGGGRGPN